MAGHGAAPGERRGGRAKGAVNKRTRELIEILDKAGYCPVADLIYTAVQAKEEYQRAELIYDAIEAKKAACGIKTPTQDMAPVYLDLLRKSAADILPYLYPKRKSVDHTVDGGQSVAGALASIFAAYAKQSSSNS